jgi:uncharacterized membrane protein YecN with MAPEG domain
MMPLVPITALYAGLLAVLLLVLALRIIRLRWKLRVGIGDGGDRMMLRAVRAHGNAAEYVPITLLLLLVVELNHGNPHLLHACGVVFVGSRVLHAVGLTRSGGPSWPRTAGTVGTMSVVIVLAVCAIAGFVG